MRTQKGFSILFASLTVFLMQTLVTGQETNVPQSVRDYPQKIRVCLNRCDSPRRQKIVEVPFKEYVLDVLAMEWGYAHWHYQAIKTGALLVKQYVLNEIDRNRNAELSTGVKKAFDVQASQKNQVYVRGAFEKKFSRVDEKQKFKDAVESTWNQLILQNGELLNVFYNSGFASPHCGNRCYRPLSVNYTSLSQNGAQRLATRQKCSMEGIVDFYFVGNSARKSASSCGASQQKPTTSIAQNKPSDFPVQIIALDDHSGSLREFKEAKNTNSLPIGSRRNGAQ